MLLLTSEQHLIILYSIITVTGNKSPKSPDINPPNVRAL
jgi:hypothetical protein